MIMYTDCSTIISMPMRGAGKIETWNLICSSLQAAALLLQVVQCYGFLCMLQQTQAWKYISKGRSDNVWPIRTNHLDQISSFASDITESNFDLNASSNSWKAFVWHCPCSFISLKHTRTAAMLHDATLPLVATHWQHAHAIAFETKQHTAAT